MSDANCTPGHEPRSVAASSFLFIVNIVLTYMVRVRVSVNVSVNVGINDKTPL